jgi:hypothetical protein
MKLRRKLRNKILTNRSKEEGDTSSKKPKTNAIRGKEEEEEERRI